MTMDRPEAVLFDKDGTILPFDPFWTTWTRTFREALLGGPGPSTEGDGRADGRGLLDWPANTRTASHGASLDVATMGVLRERIVATMVAAGTPADEAHRLVAMAARVADEVAGRQPVAAHDGFAAAVTALVAQGIRAAVVTGDDEQRAVSQVSTLGLADRITVVIGGDRGLPGKPDPATLLAGCAALDVDPTRSVYVGDSLVDVRAARAARFALALAYVPLDAEELPIWVDEADAIVRHFDELAERWAGVTGAP
jgi:phosphoglycolate phosphatase-like HAD superfamily hydrolase